MRVNLEFTIRLAISLIGIVLAASVDEARAAEPATPQPAAAASAPTPLDNSLRPGDEEVSNVFRDMGIVQRKAMQKGGRFVLSTFGTFDFSDGPYTNYSFHINPGYAISDFLEVYANIAPFYVVSARGIVDAVYTGTGGQYSLTSSRPKNQFGIDILWAPLYGKDSLGIRTIVRSDTFLKFNYSKISYEGDSGNKFALGLGKTYFLTRSGGFRFCAEFGYLQTVLNGVKKFRGMALIEAGAVFYL